MVMNHLPSQPMPTANRFSRHLMKADFKIAYEAINLRTGQPVDQEVLQGDVLRVRIKASTSNLETIEVPSHLLSPDRSQYDLLTDDLQSMSIVSWPEPVFFVQMNQPGEKKLALKIDASAAAMSARALGLDPTEIPNYLARLKKLSADAAIPLTVSPNANRPHAENKTYTYREIENVSVEQAASMINGGVAKLVVGKAEGLLGESDVAGSRAYFVSPNILASSYAEKLINLKEDGSFVFTPWRLHSIYHMLNQDYEFQYVVVNSIGTSRVATFRIEGAIVPLIEIRVFAVDEAGKEVTQLAPGQPFTLKATTVSNLGAYDLQITGNRNADVRGFKFNYRFDNAVAIAQSAPVPSSKYYTDLYRIGEEDGKLVSAIDKIPPSMTLKDGKYVADFKGYTLASSLAPITLFEQAMIAGSIGELNVKLDNLSTEAGFDVRAIQFDISKIEVVGDPDLSQNFLSPKDVNDDQTITALDALIVINSLNNMAGSPDKVSSLARIVTPGHHLDVNADGKLSALDALLIINELNLSAGKRPTQLQLSDSSTTKFGIEMNPTQPKESLVVRMLGGTPDTSYQVILDGHSVGQVETDRRGRGRLVVNKDTLTQAMQAKQAGKQKVRLEVGSLISTDLSVDLS